MRQNALITLLGYGLLSLSLLAGCQNETPNGELSMSGNVDNRQMNVAFLIAERVASIHVEEGTHVKKGDLIGELETVRIQREVALAESEVETARAAVAVAEEAVKIADQAISVAETVVLGMKATWEKAENGSRKEDIELAEAAVEMIQVQIPAAKSFYERNQRLVKTSAVSEQEFDNAESNYLKLKAELRLAETNLEKMKNGTRQEEKDAAHAQLLQSEAQLEQARARKIQAETQLTQAQATVAQAEAALEIGKQRLTDCQLFAPCDGIIRSRILEPGELASPQMPAFTLAVVSPKWVRVYAEEPQLPRIKMGQKVRICVDGLKHECEGWVGFISPNAEFTPKNVETEDLRTSLVYEVRVFVEDTDDILKLGMPVTVRFTENGMKKE